MDILTVLLISLLVVSAWFNGALLLQKSITDAEQESAVYNTVYDAIFRGTATDIKSRPGGGEIVTFHIVKPIRLNPAVAHLDLDYHDLIDVVSSDGRPGCFFGFDLDRIYTVYSHLEGGVLVTDACWGTDPYYRVGSISLDDAVHPLPWP